MSKTVRDDIKTYRSVIDKVMAEELGKISDQYIKEIIKKHKETPASNRQSEINKVPLPDFTEYKEKLKIGITLISDRALKKARKQIPKLSKVKLKEFPVGNIHLGEFDDLPGKLKKFILFKIDLLTGLQEKSLNKAVMVQYTAETIETNSVNSIRESLFNEVNKTIIEGPPVKVGAHIVSAETVNETRKSFFQSDEVSEELEALQFVNDVPVTDICTDLNGTIFSPNDPGYETFNPPLHYNCDSYIIPVINTKGRSIEPLNVSSAHLKDQIQFHEGHDCGNSYLKELYIKKIQ